MSGKIDNHSIELLHTGVGENICRQRIAPFLQDRQFDYLISAGFAGALTDQLQTGDLLIAKNFSTLELGPALRNVSLHVVDLVTTPKMVALPEERNRLAKETRAAAVDMETEFIARACAEHALRMISLRVISDTPIEPFPAPPDVLFDIVSQRTSMMKLGAFFMKHPKRISSLIRFANRVAHARHTLATAIVDVVQATSF